MTTDRYLDYIVDIDAQLIANIPSSPSRLVTQSYLRFLVCSGEIFVSELLLQPVIETVLVIENDCMDYWMPLQTLVPGLLCNNK